jgi:two-component sensor histidine kinase
LSYAIAIVLALIVHELTTNAVKYGTLSDASGRIRVAWSIGGDQLVLEWVESGGPQPTVSTREGFGSKLLRSGVRQFQGSVDSRFEPTGLQCRFSLTMPKGRKRATAEVTNRVPQGETVLVQAKTKII